MHQLDHPRACIRGHAAAMKSHGLRLRGKQTVAARPAMAALARVPTFVEGARMPSLAARPDAKAAKAVRQMRKGGQADDVRPLSKTCWAELGAHFHDCWRWRLRVIQELPNSV